jgi:putative membrane protein
MLWFKTFHILFVMSWMAGIFYLPRILVHYVEGRTAGEDTRRLIIMADKLFRFSVVMAVIALSTGLVLWLYYGIAGQWLYAKLVFIAALMAYQYQTLRYIGQMRRDELDGSSLFFRIFNEGALVLVIPILIFVVVKPL